MLFDGEFEREWELGGFYVLIRDSCPLMTNQESEEQFEAGEPDTWGEGLRERKNGIILDMHPPAYSIWELGTGSS